MHTYTVHIFEIIPNKLYCVMLYIKVYVKMLVRNRKKSRSIILKLDLTMARNKRFDVRSISQDNPHFHGTNSKCDTLYSIL